MKYDTTMGGWVRLAPAEELPAQEYAGVTIMLKSTIWNVVFVFKETGDVRANFTIIARSKKEAFWHFEQWYNAFSGNGDEEDSSWLQYDWDMTFWDSKYDVQFLAAAKVTTSQVGIISKSYTW